MRRAAVLEADADVRCGVETISSRRCLCCPLALPLALALALPLALALALGLGLLVAFAFGVVMLDQNDFTLENISLARGLVADADAAGFAFVLALLVGVRHAPPPRPTPLLPALLPSPRAGVFHPDAAVTSCDNDDFRTGILLPPLPLLLPLFPVGIDGGVRARFMLRCVE